MTTFTQPMTQTKLRGSHSSEYEIFLAFADNGQGLDITNNLKPLPTFEEWMAR